MAEISLLLPFCTVGFKLHCFKLLRGQDSTFMNNFCMEISSSREGKSEIIAKNRIYWGAFDFLSRYVSLKIVFWCLALSLKTKKDN